MFKKILIANRGEIACRVIATAHKMGIKTVAVYSEADKEARHVQLADEAVLLGPAPSRESYLVADKIIAAAKATGAQAIHPGYGFLSENTDFAKRCEEEGIAFIGPKAHSIAAMGDKIASKKLALEAKVNTIPGYNDAIDTAEQAVEIAKGIGYPVMIKASAGGGGKGLRVAFNDKEALEGFTSCRNEARNSFGDDRVFIEKYVLEPRHIEIQVLGDSHGNVVYLNERECSIQRRHQKVIEEAPSPFISDATRKAMGEQAVALAKAVKYQSAGTVEFVVGKDQDFYFLEMNTRLQVEHPVTEAITGLDLVEWQLRVASGEPLPLQQSDLRIHGHAIEARICAENPDNNFLPATGTLAVYRKPTCSSFELANASSAGGSVRIDDGVREGDSISPFYDSMVAKLIVHGDTREQALARLDEALSQTRIVGLTTNVQFLRHIIRTDSFATAKLDTALIQREDKALFGQEAVGLPLAAASVVAHTLHQELAQVGHDPFSQRDGWRAYGVATRPFGFNFHGASYTAVLRYLADGVLQLAVGEGDDAVTGALVWRSEGDALHVSFAEQNARVQVFIEAQAHEEVAHVFAPQGATRITVVDALAHAGDTQEAGGRLTAPMPGKVVSFAVAAGDKVKAGQPLAVMEAMKMEHTIAAPADGEVLELLYAPGDQVTEGAELLKLKV